MEESDRKIRALGGLLILIGVLLSGGMSWLILHLKDVIDHPGVKGRWNGGPEFTEAAFRLLYSVLAFGVASLLPGIGQATTGKRNRVLLLPLLAACLWLTYSLWAFLSLDKTL